MTARPVRPDSGARRAPPAVALAWLIGSGLVVAAPDTRDTPPGPLDRALVEFLIEWTGEDGTLIDPALFEPMPAEPANDRPVRFGSQRHE